MKTYVVTNKDDKQIGFEIDHTFFSVRQINKILSGIVEVDNIKTKDASSLEDDVVLEFEYFHCKYIVWEAYGDSSRYWIGPKVIENCNHEQVSRLEQIFKKHTPSIFERFISFFEK